MVVGVGIDIVQNSRINKGIAINKLSFIKKILTEEELDQINLKSLSAQRIAGIFATKEAVTKSLSSFLGFALNFQQIIIRKNNIFPEVHIIKEVAKDKLTNIKLTISISHEKAYTISICIAETINLP